MLQCLKHHVHGMFLFLVACIHVLIRLRPLHAVYKRMYADVGWFSGMCIIWAHSHFLRANVAIFSGIQTNINLQKALPTYAHKVRTCGTVLKSRTKPF